MNSPPSPPPPPCRERRHQPGWISVMLLKTVTPLGPKDGRPVESSSRGPMSALPRRRTRQNAASKQHTHETECAHDTRARTRPLQQGAGVEGLHRDFNRKGEREGVNRLAWRWHWRASERSWWASERRERTSSDSRVGRIGGHYRSSARRSASASSAPALAATAPGGRRIGGHWTR